VPQRCAPAIRNPGSILAGLVNLPAVTVMACAARFAGGATDLEIASLPFCSPACYAGGV